MVFVGGMEERKKRSYHRPNENDQPKTVNGLHGCNVIWKTVIIRSEHKRQYQIREDRQ